MKRALNLLLVEDSQTDVELLLAELHEYGFDTAFACVDSEARLRDALAAQSWEIVICDHGLPAFGSIDALQVVRESGADIPFVILSGTIGEEAAVEALKAGACDVVLKGNLPRLGPVVDRELRAAENRRHQEHLAHERAELEGQLNSLNAELRASELHYRLLFELNPEPTLVYDLASLEIVSVNAALIVRYGYSREECASMMITDLLPPEEVSLLLDFLAARPNESQVGFTEGFAGRAWRHRYKDGTVIDVEVTSANLVVGVRDCRIAVYHNVTERNRAATERATMEHNFAIELASQNDRLRELDALKDQFVSVVSHELRTPLTAIRGYLEIVLGEEPGPLTEEQKRCLAIADASSEQLLRVVGDLLLIGKLEAGHLTLEIGEVDLASMLDACVIAARPAADAKQIGLRLIPTLVPLTAGDLGRLSQAVGNIISNAIKFTEDGQVEVRLHAEADQAVIEVVDTGTGVPANEVGHLFVPFFRATTATRQAIPGTGLGLSIAKEIIEAHGGSILLETEVGSGTSVRVVLPAVTAR